MHLGKRIDKNSQLHFKSKRFVLSVLKNNKQVKGPQINDIVFNCFMTLWLPSQLFKLSPLSLLWCVTLVVDENKMCKDIQSNLSGKLDYYRIFIVDDKFNKLFWIRSQIYYLLYLFITYLATQYVLYTYIAVQIKYNV